MAEITEFTEITNSQNFDRLQLIKPTIIEIGIVIALLLAGGYIEFYMIELVENENLEMPGF